MADDPRISRFSSAFAKGYAPHRKRCDDYAKRDRQYEGVLERKNDSWESQLHPPYVYQTIDTLEASLVDPDVKFRVRPTTPTKEASAGCLEKIIGVQMRKGHFNERLGTWVKQALVRGVSPAKVAWVQETRTVRERNFATAEPMPDGSPAPEQPASVEKTPVVKDQPELAVLDANDFWWDPAATSLDDCEWVMARFYPTVDALRAMPSYDQGVVEALAKSNEAPTVEATKSPVPTRLPLNLKGRVEVIEWWKRGHLMVVANRNTVLYDGANPYYHGDLPFAVITTLPLMFRLEGKSDVELIADIQAEIWELGNQRIDNTKLISNGILLIDPRLDEKEKLKVAPGAVLEVQNPQMVQWMRPETSILGATMQAEEQLKGDLQNMTAAIPFLVGQDAQGMGGNTATGASITSNMAQKRVAKKKSTITTALERVGAQFIALNQQCLPKWTAIRIDGDDGASEYLSVSAAEIAGQYDFLVDGAQESLLRQERRAEIGTWFQTIMANYPLLVQAGVQIDLRAVLQDYLKAWDRDPGRYLPAPPPPAPMAPGAALAPPPGGPAGALGATTPMPPGAAPGAPANFPTGAAGAVQALSANQPIPLRAPPGMGNSHG